tara:strand:- start:238 stop:1776 length:1539 start_codon:yes stop_codon:yes gene_type:complete
MLTKKFKQNYHKDWLNQLDIEEAKQDKKWAKYLVNESNVIIEEFLRANKQIPSLQFKFKESDLTKLYVELYQEVGNKFAKWYAQNFDKYITKNIDVEYQDIWNQKFAYIGSQVAGARVVSVSGNRKKEFVRVLSRYMADPDFQSMNEVQAGRILRKKFKSMSVNNAKRIVRTESTNAANYATNQSATDVFGKENLQKEWIATLDERVRIDHAEANGQVVDMDKNFLVGGEELAYPGDSRGSAANVINCRCTNAPFPKEEIIEQSIPERIEPMPVRVPRQRVVQEERPNFYPSAIDDLKKQGYKIDDKAMEVTKLLKAPVSIKLKRKGNSFASESGIEINIKNFNTKNTINRVLVHEIGHMAHKQNRWAKYVPGKKRNPILDNDVKETFEKWRKQLGYKQRESVQNEALKPYKKLFDYDEFYKIQSQFPELSAKDYTSFHGAMSDFFGALTKNKVGYGHSNAYYTRGGVFSQVAEVLAHSFENYYLGNPVFKKLYPKIYQETIELIETLINKI